MVLTARFFRQVLLRAVGCSALLLAVNGQGSVGIAAEVSLDQRSRMDRAACLDVDAEPSQIIAACKRSIAGTDAAGPELANLWIARGDAEVKIEQSGAAMRSFAMATEIDPENAYAWRSLGWEQTTSQDDAAALVSADRAILLDPDHSNGYELKGRALRRLGRLDDALDALTIAIALDPGDDWTMRTIGWVHHDKGDYARAEQDFRRAVRDDPNDPWNHYALGYVLDDLRRREEAVEAFTAAIDLDDGEENFFYYRAYSYRRLAKYDLALSDLERAEELDPTDHWISYQRGWILMDKEDDATVQDAGIAFQKAIDLAPDQAGSYYGLGAVRARLSRTEGAIGALTKALSISHEAEDASAVVSELLGAGAYLTALKASRMIDAAAREAAAAE